MKLLVWITAEMDIPDAIASRLQNPAKDAEETSQRVAKEALARAFANCDRLKVETTAHAEDGKAKA